MDSRVLRKIKTQDKLVRWIISSGGVSIIICLVGMILFMFSVAWPLFQDSESQLGSAFNLENNQRESRIVDFGSDYYLETGYVLYADGTMRFIELQTGKTLGQKKITRSGKAPEAGAGNRAATIVGAHRYGHHALSLLWEDGTVSLEEIVFKAEFLTEQDRTIVQKVTHKGMIGGADGQPNAGPVQALSAYLGQPEEGRLLLVKLLPDNQLLVVDQGREEDFLGNVEIQNWKHMLKPALEGNITQMAVAGVEGKVYIGTDRGELLAWELKGESAPELMAHVQAFEDHRAISALNFVLGEVSLAVGDEKGGLSTWSFIPGSEGFKLVKLHQLRAHESKIIEIIPALDDKSIVSLDEKGVVHIDHMTSERSLLTLTSEIPLQNFSITSRGNGLMALDSENKFWIWSLDIPHPETSFTTLFGKVHYEGYAQKKYVWQSSSASDDFEPKLSLTPLIFGSLKGTFYSMLLAIPISVLGAMYVSHLMSARMKKVIKPAVELMAAIPSVVIGFLAALWLAPRFAENLPGVFAGLVTIPITVMIGMGVLFRFVKMKPGREFLYCIPLIVVGGLLASKLGHGMEAWFFNGDFKVWAYNFLGTGVDQRNCVVIAFGLGFAVIPIIFTISEDSLSNVPPNMTAASLALGSSRWQALRRVVLPMASPGIFAATMIGFGRAVGETMIVLMATGNTPLMDINIFNGMRTLAANIATEIPEAPAGGTLFRVLFLSAIILFLLTLIVNTLAELVRQRLRKKYESF